MSEKRKTLNFNNKRLYLEVDKYNYSGNIAIIAYTKNDLYGDITINLNGYFVDEDEGFINSITKDSGLENKLISEGIIKEVVTSVKHNMGTYDLVVFDLEKLKEYDPEGMQCYNEVIEELE